MLRYENDEARHTTSKCSTSHGEPIGIDLFDDEFTDEFGPQTSIYLRHADGTRWPARSVSMCEAKHYQSVIGSWATRGDVNDYRTALKGKGL